MLVSINSDSAEHARRLNTEAAKSMHWGGLTEDEVFAFVTINPAKQLKIDNRVGSLEVGKDADVVIWNKHPLSTYAIVDRVYIDGQQYYDRLAEERRLTDAGKEKNTLTSAEGRTAPSTAPQTPQPRTGSDPKDDVLPQTVPGLGGVQQAPATGPVTAITNARIYPISSAPIERGTIVIRGNRIEAVGANVAVPAGAQVIDAKGGEVYPGFIDARTTIGLNEPGPRGFEDTSEMLEINASVKAQVAYQSDSDAIPVARVNGITTRRGDPVRRTDRRTGGGDEPRRLDVGRGHAPAGGRRQLPVPAARARRVWRRRRRQRREPQVRGSEEGARCARAARRGSDCPGARLREDSGRQSRHRLEPRRAWRRSPNAGSRCLSPPATKPTSARPWPSPIAPTSAS